MSDLQTEIMKVIAKSMAADMEDIMFKDVKCSRCDAVIPRSEFDICL